MSPIKAIQQRLAATALSSPYSSSDNPRSFLVHSSGSSSSGGLDEPSTKEKKTMKPERVSEYFQDIVALTNAAKTHKDLRQLFQSVKSLRIKWEGYNPACPRQLNNVNDPVSLFLLKH